METEIWQPEMQAAAYNKLTEELKVVEDRVDKLEVEIKHAIADSQREDTKLG